MNILEVKSPYNQALLGNLPYDTPEQLEQKLSTACKLHFENRQGLPVKKRIEVLEKTAELMRLKQDELIQTALFEGGKPYQDSVGEILRAINGVELCIEYLKTSHGKTVPMGLNAASQNHSAYTRREPIGVVVAISAFNHPVNLIIHQVVTAFAAGCPVLIKPDLRTPLSCFAVLQILHEAGIPEGWCQGIICTNPQAEKLATDPRVHFLNFIGSAKVGWYLRSKLPAGTRCALEHGGLAPAIILPDAPIDQVIPALIKGSFYHAGQVCVSTQRIFVPQSLSSEFCQIFTDHAQKLKTGDPSLPETQVGPIITKTELERIDNWVKEAVQKGAELLCGGEILSAGCYSPTVLLNPSADSKISQLEIFGPVVAIYTYSDIQEAITQANQTSFHFQAAVFSSDITKAESVAEQLDAAAVMINDHTAFRVDWMPFGGRDHSGLGVGGIQYSIEDMQPEKLIVIRHTS